ncbi:uncharacterized protein LOC110225003, partial [Arabidopsis lyrata subsp. lyrata]|uniref:uncharacterized protein LOC110225003 n=1 Tax=Arabidopsis lyrata subsp. lyrata TaxID=81972 RepID=UPI000A29CCCB
PNNVLQNSFNGNKIFVGGGCRCQRVIEMLQACCERCNNESTHCGSVAALLKQIKK